MEQNRCSLSKTAAVPPPHSGRHFSVYLIEGRRISLTDSRVSRFLDRRRPPSASRRQFSWHRVGRKTFEDLAKNCHPLPTTAILGCEIVRIVAIHRVSWPVLSASILRTGSTFRHLGPTPVRVLRADFPDTPHPPADLAWHAGAPQPRHPADQEPMAPPGDAPIHDRVEPDRQQEDVFHRAIKQVAKLGKSAAQAARLDSVAEHSNSHEK